MAGSSRFIARRGDKTAVTQLKLPHADAWLFVYVYVSK